MGADRRYYTHIAIPVLATLTLGAVVLGVPRVQEDRTEAGLSQPAGARLAPTEHPPLPAQRSDYWFVPEVAVTRTTAPTRADDPAARLVRGAALIAAGDFAAGLPLVNTPALAASPLGAYAQYYTGVALHGLSRFAEADAALTTLLARGPQGVLRERSTLALADALIARGEAGRAEDLLEDLSDEKLSVPEDVLLKLGAAEEAVGHRDHALEAYRRVYYEYPLGAQASDAQAALERLQTPATASPEQFTLARARAERLFSARRWAQARAAFEPLARVARGDDRELVALRLAECDYYLNRHRAAHTALQPFLKSARREAEARFFHLSATRGLGDHATYVALARNLVADHPESAWAEETLNNLASHYIRIDDDAQADRVFRELSRRFPRSRHRERAAWKIGWRAYRVGEYLEAATVFDEAAVAFPRADNRPAWLYWSGRARARLGDSPAAAARYQLVIADYQNLYYGRLAAKLLDTQAPAGPRSRGVSVPGASGSASASAGGPVDTAIPTSTLIRELIAAGLLDEALAEVQYAQRVWGDTPRLQATSAWIRHQQGLASKGQERFNALRGAITTMRRAYPQFMAAGGETLPPDVLRIIYPLDYWPLIKKYSDLHKLDPYLMAALMAQESTFTAEIRSAANAHGLMQIIPGTGSRYARKLGIRPFSTASLSVPEINVRIGTQYFKELVDRFGGAHFALASYNAGENRVQRWIKEKPRMPVDEFIDDIPFPETQTYVKRILGTAEDYRRLYGGGLLDPQRGASSATAARPAAPRSGASTSRQRN